MANLRRHFNFSTKSSVQQDREMSYSSSSNKSFYQQFDKASLMNDICDCLKLCSSYIQTLNSLCGAGSSLARNLFHAVREIPAFHQVSLQFLYIWEEASKATAGASAAVKTETLMMLQEILNSLEIRKNDEDADATIAESFQVIGTCLCSFIELQAQFSLSTWKSLSKLSKHFTSDSVRHGLQKKSLERTPSKIVVNTDLNATIKKHFSQLFSKVEISKVNEHIEHIQSQATTPPQPPSDVPMYSHFGNQNIPDSSPQESVWGPQPALWNSGSGSNTPYPKNTVTSEQEIQNSPATSSDLDEVINLLSCVPSQSSTRQLNSANQNYFQYGSNNEQMYHHLPKVSMHAVSRQLSNQRAWRKDNFDPWLWRADNMNCTGLPGNTDVIKLQAQTNGDPPSQWEIKELQKWNNTMYETGSSSDDGSSAHGSDIEYYSNAFNGSYGKRSMSPFTNRKHNNGESMPGGLENISESKEEYLWTHSKISTWPLKQSSYRMSDSDCPDSSECSEYSPHFMS